MTHKNNNNNKPNLSVQARCKTCPFNCAPAQMEKNPAHIYKNNLTENLLNNSAVNPQEIKAN